MIRQEPTFVGDLKSAVARREIRAFFQPQIDMLSGRFVAVEALARWKHPKHGTLSPDIFIRAAHEHHLIDELGLVMIDEAWRCARGWYQQGLRVQVSVNASAAQFTSDALIDRVRELSASSALPPHTMTLEITESDAFDDLDHAAEILREVRSAGIGVSIDDFGVGHSTLERLEALPVNELKIDISMVQDETDEGYASLMEIAEYAHSHGIRVVAEGVETEEQRKRVELLRCERAQGFLWSEALDERAAGVLLREQIRR